jgi:hypothetical protein
VLQRLKALPLAFLRGVARLGRRILRVTAIVAAVTALLIALDALFLPDEEEETD